MRRNSITQEKLSQHNTYKMFLSSLRNKDKPAPMVPTGVIAARHANYVGNYMSNPKSNWSNPQTAPPSCWEGKIYDKR